MSRQPISKTQHQNFSLSPSGGEGRGEGAMLPQIHCLQNRKARAAARFLSSAACAAALLTTAHAADFNIPGGDLEKALDTYSKQAGIRLMYSDDAVKGVRTRGVNGAVSSDDALTKLLSGTGFIMQHRASGTVTIVRDERAANEIPVANTLELAQLGPSPRSSVETVTVTSSKLGSTDVQTVPIAITAMSQEQLTATQTAGGPDLVKNVPNLTFSKTNFNSYNIEIRGIGTQAVSATTDPAVAVAFNDIPFISNHFFEQEFFDVSQVEVLRGPQGTLYGRNATAGVVNVVSAKPTDHYEAQASVDVGNYNNRRLEGMLNIPIVDDRLDLRLAGEWTKRDGYTYDSTTQSAVDGRDLWSGRVSLLVHPIESLTATVIWEHFHENDDRLRSGKTLCHTDPGPSSIDGPAGLVTNIDVSGKAWLSQGCKAGSLYGPDAFGVPNPASTPFIQLDEYVGQLMEPGFNPYGTLSQSTDLRDIGSALRPQYQANDDTLEFNINYDISPSLILVSQSGYSKDFIYSTEDYNRFDTVHHAFLPGHTGAIGQHPVGTDGFYCDPQLGCSDQYLAEDLSDGKAEQFYQEVRLASHITGALNFSIGASYLHYTVLENYYLFSNTLSLSQETINQVKPDVAEHISFDPVAANACDPVQSTTHQNFNNTLLGLGCGYVDPNPLSQLDGMGHNYFRSENPYRLHSWAGFGEAYYQLTPDVKLTGGLRWTDDQKSFTEIPSWTVVAGKGYPIFSVLDQQWKEWTGRFNATWTPKLDFTDQSMFYASYSRGYKGGGANPPGVVPITIHGRQIESPSNYTHPLTFKPEFVDAFEVGSKNSLLDGGLTLNGDVFYYKYQDYQISSIVDRTAINDNFNATVRGAEIEATWEPLPGLRFNFAGGYEDGTLDKGDRAIDLIDRTAGNPGWMVVRPFPTETSSCILPTGVVNQMIAGYRTQNGGNNSTPVSALPGNGLYYSGDGTSALSNACLFAYSYGFDPLLLLTGASSGFDPATAPNGGQGFFKELSGNKLPNMPPFTLSLGGQYSMPLSEDWAGTLRGDFYWQGNSFARVFNDKPYDQIHGYTNLNLALIFTNQDGWQAMAYVKNVVDTTAITGAFLNSDDTGLSTNVFLTDPRLFGIRITKNW